MPLAALNIFNGMFQNKAEEYLSIKEFTILSKQELDGIETLVQSLLTITTLDAGSTVIEKDMKYVVNTMNFIIPTKL